MKTKISNQYPSIYFKEFRPPNLIPVSNQGTKLYHPLRGTANSPNAKLAL